jgi:hypothetical protein
VSVENKSKAAVPAASRHSPGCRGYRGCRRCRCRSWVSTKRHPGSATSIRK